MPRPPRPPRPILLLCLALLAGAGCSRTTLRESERPTSRPVQGVGRGYFEPRVEAFVVPPRGWSLDKDKATDEHTNLTWLSPTRDTAYGVIFARVPGWVPVAFIPARSLHETVLNKFMEKMKEDQGEATVVSQQWNDDRDRLEFVARGTTYTLDAYLTVRGYDVWTVYRGTFTGKTASATELELAGKARDATGVGRDAAKSATRGSD